MNFVIKQDIVFWVEYKNKITTMYYNLADFKQIKAEE